MNSTSLKYFITVAECKSVTKAAEKLYISQPALSKQIKNLENDLSCELFDRDTREFEINKYGEIVYTYSKEILKLLDDMESEIKSLKNEDINTIEIAVLSASTLLTKIMKSFSDSFPETKFNIIQDNNINRDVPLKVFSLKEKLEDTSNRYILFGEEIKLAVPKSHYLADRDSVSLHELEDYSFLKLVKGSNLREITDEFCKENKLKFKSSIECDNPQLLRKFIELGLGLSLVPEKTWAFELDNIKLLDILPNKLKRYVYLEVQNENILNSSEKKFIEFLLENLNKLQL